MRTIFKKWIKKGSKEILFMKWQALWVVRTQTNIATARVLVADVMWAKSPKNAWAAPAPKVHFWIKFFWNPFNKREQGNLLFGRWWRCCAWTARRVTKPLRFRSCWDVGKLQQAHSWIQNSYWKQLENKEWKHASLFWKWTRALWVVRTQTNIATRRVR